MKYIIDSIVNQIKNNLIPSDDEEMMIKINGFSKIEYYKNISDAVYAYCNDNNISIGIKLANKKYQDFSVDNINFKNIEYMKQRGWIAENESITYYRNLHKYKLLLLLGTEDEDDKDGLLNCSEVTPESLAKNLNNNYFEVFSNYLDSFEDSEIKIVNKLYKDLFEYIPVDICKLSEIADNLENQISDIQDFVERFYSSLPEWGLPIRNDNIPDSSKIMKKSNILQNEYKIISHKLFEKISNTKFNEYLRKFSEYDGEYKNNNYWATQKSINNYEEYVNIFTNFITGKDIENNRNILINIDIAVAEDIFDLKLEKEKPITKDKDNIISGSPLKVFTKVLLKTMLDNKEKDYIVSKISIDFKSVSIISEFSEIENSESDESTALKNCWHNICCHTNGIFEYINNRDWTINNNPLSIELKSFDFFNPKIFDDAIIENAGSTKKNNTIEFTSECLDLDGKSIRGTKTKYKWIFTNTDPWLNEFTAICNSDVFSNIEKYIPISVLNNINNLITATSEEEFFDILDNSDIELTKEMDICEYVINRLNNETDSSLKADFIYLAQNFKKFGLALQENGYYKLLSSLDSDLYNFINAYEKLGNELTAEVLPDNKKFLLSSFINAFCIEQNLNSVKAEEESSCCIVPPWNPVALEKLNNQKVFFLDGCSEWYANLEELPSEKQINDQIELLEEMSVVKNAAVVFPSVNHQYYGAINSFGSYSLYAESDLSNENRIKESILKDSIFDESYSNEELIGYSEDSHMILHILNSYVKSFNYSKFNLKLTFINPGELQPIISAIYYYVTNLAKERTDNKINIELHVIIKPENRGGKNYLSYWMNKFFSENEFINVKTYITEWNDSSSLTNCIEENNDIIFFKDFLSARTYSFSVASSYEAKNRELSSCKFPIVYRPKLVSNTTANKRCIELSQPQFKAEMVHSQAVYYSKQTVQSIEHNFIATQEMRLEQKTSDIIFNLHSHSNWVVCIDSGLDGALLRNETAPHNNDYSVIGFSTGNGNYGKYNMTITSRKSIIDTIKDSFRIRLSHLFKWDQELINKVVTRCMNEATCLDGISLLSAINIKDNNINEFMAYVLTSFRENKKEHKVPLQVLIHLDSYKHWFSNEIIETLDNSASRSDFLSLELAEYNGDKLKLNADIIECKIAKIDNAETHINKAKYQVMHTMKRLQQIFNPSSDSVLRRYWFAQLYRALTFSQVTFSNNQEEYEIVAEKLRLILDGNFEINWKGDILGYWIDGEAENESVINEDGINIHNIPQKAIQKMFINDGNTEIKFNAQIDDACFMTEEERMNQNKDIKDSNIIPTSSNINNIKTPIDSTEHNDTSKDIADIVIEDNITHKNTDERNMNDYENLKVAETKPDYSSEPTSSTRDLEKIRVLIGKNRLNEDVYWEFGNKELTNRHLLITGTSGQGKTYCIQTLLYELSKSNVSTVIFDYTAGFTPEQLDPIFKDKIGDKIEQPVVRATGVPINPFKRYEIFVNGITIPENSVDVANRIKSIFSHVYKFGAQQESVIYEAIKTGIDEYKENFTMNHFIEKLQESKNNTAATVLSKIKPFADSVTFDEKIDWGEIIYSPTPKVYIFQLVGYDQETQVIITEMLLWNLWYYACKFGNKEKPFTVVLDEAQNLSHKHGSPTEKILTEGRKFGWSAWFATQSLQVLDDDEITRLLQAAYKIYFKPTDSEMAKTAKILNPANSSEWIPILNKLKKGKCIVSGDRCDSTGNLKATKPTITDVTSLGER